MLSQPVLPCQFSCEFSEWFSFIVRAQPSLVERSCIHMLAACFDFFFFGEQTNSVFAIAKNLTNMLCTGAVRQLVQICLLYNSDLQECFAVIPSNVLHWHWKVLLVFNRVQI